MLLAFDCRGMREKQSCQQISANAAWKHSQIEQVMQSSLTSFPHSNSVVSMLKVHKGKRMSDSQFPLLLTYTAEAEEMGHFQILSKIAFYGKQNSDRNNSCLR